WEKGNKESHALPISECIVPKESPFQLTLGESRFPRRDIRGIAAGRKIWWDTGTSIQGTLGHDSLASCLVSIVIESLFASRLLLHLNLPPPFVPELFDFSRIGFQERVNDHRDVSCDG